MKFTLPIVLAAIVFANSTVALPASEKFELDARAADHSAAVLMERSPSFFGKLFKGAKGVLGFRRDEPSDLYTREIFDYDSLRYERSFEEDDELFARYLEEPDSLLERDYMEAEALVERDPSRHLDDCWPGWVTRDKSSGLEVRGEDLHTRMEDDELFERFDEDELLGRAYEEELLERDFEVEY